MYVLSFNIMKKKYYTLGIGILLVCTACTDWLTVQPETSVTAEILFTTDDGVKQGLNGAYYLAEQGVYNPIGALGGGGYNSFIEDMANTYDYSSAINSDSYFWSNHLYEQTTSQKTVNGNVFIKPYKIIANLNSLINEMIKNRDEITPEVYNIVRGEALAFRACCHLDLLRIYGPVPSSVDAGKAYLPYVRVNDVNTYPYHTFDQYMEYVQADLDSAEVYLAKSEPVLTTTFESTESTWNTPWPYRRSRINYYGVLGLQARAALWRGDQDKALRYAKLVKDAKNEDGTFKFRFTTPEDNLDNNNYSVTDLTHYTEHVCGVKCGSWFDATRGTDSPWRYGEGTVISYNSIPFLKGLYGDNYEDDLRVKHFWKVVVNDRDTVKDPVTGEPILTDWGSIQLILTPRLYSIGRWDDFNRNATNAKRNFPIVRLPEMYFIIMECGTLSEANEVYKEYCVARGITYVPLTESDRKERVIMESIKEYVGEGQNFFTYKRNDVRRIYRTDSGSRIFRCKIIEL
ncbi:MAG: hypothetical protein BHV81_13470 [Butyricimonas synergistica]|nr:MAG: hypothetical protein BHV81_13470 [Butyricimonas synergistica]